MGLLVKGEWLDQWYDTSKSGGEFVRQDAQFRHSISENGEFKPAANRYHLFVSLACPWAHRTLIFRKIKKLEDIIAVTIVDAEMLEHGWQLPSETTLPDIQGLKYLHQVYQLSESNYSGRVTVPVLWDTHTKQIVNNESSEIIRILNTQFNGFTDVKTDFYPEALRSEIDAVNELVYHTINNGVYKAGFATEQNVYEKHCKKLFESLDALETRLAKQRYLVGNNITEADWRLFTTLIRFDSVYFAHFKCNLRSIESYPNLSNYVKDLYQYPGVAETVNFEHIKTHYYYSHDMINPTRVVPLGPEINYLAKHDRDRF